MSSLNKGGVYMFNIEMEFNGTEYLVFFRDFVDSNGYYITTYKIGEFLVDFLNTDLDRLYNKVQWKSGNFNNIISDTCEKLFNDTFSIVTIGLILSSMQKEPDWPKPDLHYDYPNSVHTKELFNQIVMNIFLFKTLVQAILAKEADFSQLPGLDCFKTKLVYDNKTQEMGQLYIIEDIYNLVVLDLFNVSKRPIHIKQCQNCNRFFITGKRSDEIYCDNVYRNNRTCKDLGYEMKEKNDPFKKMYRTAYKTRHSRIRQRKHIPDYRKSRFEPWVEDAKKALDYYSQKEDLDGFRKWLDDNKNAYDE